MSFRKVSWDVLVPLVVAASASGTALVVVIGAARLGLRLPTPSDLPSRIRQRFLEDELATTKHRLEISVGQVARLTQLKTSLEKDLGDLRCAYAAQHRRRLLEDIAFAEPAIPVTPAPPIGARVAAVKSDVSPVLVLLSAGSDDKVEKGQCFWVYRGSEFVGKVVVEKVLRDSCGCRVLFTKEGMSIQPGDSAATRLQQNAEGAAIGETTDSADTPSALSAPSAPPR